MELLHLTDLHVTDPHESLDEVWATVEEQLGERRFDFVLVSGDLTQRAAASEYARLHSFLHERIRPRLRSGWPERVILVPGNHDVDWEQSIGQPIDLGGGLDSHTRAQLRLYQRQPERARLRMRITDDARLQLVRIDEARYCERWRNLGAFLREFYGEALRAPHRPFVLEGADAEHWSAHLFPDQGIAFYGFNSCLNNDSLWTGAAISKRAIMAAATHARQHARGLLRVAVWHHGLVSDRGRADHLTIEDLGFLVHNGFRLGVHGHTHQDEFGDWADFLDDRFPIVATGSLGAGPSERPGGVRNQFAVIHLNAAYLQIERFSRSDRDARWSAEKKPPYPIGAAAAAGARTHSRSFADLHRRTIVLDESTGVADVTVTLGNVRLDGELTLATPTGGFSNIHFDPVAETADGMSLPVRVDELGGERRRFVIWGNGDEHAWVTWSYSVSNAFALNRAELPLRRRPAEWERLVPDEHDAAVHGLQFRCNQLRIELRSRNATPLFSPPAVVRAVKPTERAGAAQWTHDAGESARAEVVTTPEAVTASFSAPTVGYRYVLAYRPERAGAVIPPRVLTLTGNLLARLRRAPEDHPVTTQVERGLRYVLKVKEKQSLVWYGYLWSAEARQLITGFGRIPRFSGAFGFDHGNGVTGHAFRHGLVASYHRANGGSIIYQPPMSPTGGPVTEFQWIVAVPILLSAGGPAVGVVGFAGGEDEGRGWARDLANYARNAAVAGGDTPDAAHDSALDAFEDSLVAAATITFWNAVAKLRDLDRFDLAEARRVLAACSGTRPPREPRVTANKRASTRRQSP